jgi:hypothetical protein
MRGVETVFEVFHDEHDAIDSFFPDRDVSKWCVYNEVIYVKIYKPGDLPGIPPHRDSNRR